MSMNMMNRVNFPSPGRRPLLALGVAAILLAACGSSGSTRAVTADAASSPASTGGRASAEPVTLRLGYFPNITHATALVGVGKGIFEEKLGDNVTLETSTFSTGTEASEALFADAIDMTYIGPNPAINAYAKSDGDGRPDHLRRDLRRGLPRREAGDQQRRRPEGQDARHARAWATPRTWHCGPG